MTSIYYKVKKIQQRKSSKKFAKEIQEWSDHEDQESLESSTMPSPVLKHEGRHKLSHIIKSLLFETALAIKIQARKIGKKHGSNGSSLRSSNGESHDDDHGKLSQSTSSLTNSSVFSSSTLSSTATTSSSVTRSRSISERFRLFRSISSINMKASLKNLSDKFRSFNHRSNPRNKTILESMNLNGLKKEQHAHFAEDVIESDEKKNSKGDERKCYHSVSGLCFLLMSMMGLVFYGKVWAILCSSVWLVCLPLFSLGDHQSSTDMVMLIEKKEVVVDGES